MEKRCLNCGCVITEGTKFCKNCGTQVPADMAEPVPAVFKEPVEAVTAEVTVGKAAAEAEKEAAAAAETVKEAAAETVKEAAAEAAGEVKNAAPGAEKEPLNSRDLIYNDPEIKREEMERLAAMRQPEPHRPAFGAEPPTAAAPQAPENREGVPGQGKPEFRGDGIRPGVLEEDVKPRKKGVGVVGYLLVALLSLLSIASLCILTVISAFTLVDDSKVLSKLENGADSGVGALDFISTHIPDVSNYVYMAIAGVIFLIFAVLIIIVASRRPAVAFRTIAVDMLIVSLSVAFGLLFLNTYGGKLGALDLDCTFFTLLRTSTSEWLLIFSAGLLVPAVLLLIAAGITDGVRHRRKVKEALAADPAMPRR